jgi:NAD(P)-dependent dehydrogenase (short-subunit alcohol dehydrogenase family)
MEPRPDHGEESYKGFDRLKDKVAVVTGGDSGIGRAVALAFAREGADILVSYWSEHEDARETQKIVEAAGRRAVLVSGDLAEESQCRQVIDAAARELAASTCSSTTPPTKASRWRSSSRSMPSGSAARSR